jgi:hypothetical protein
MMQAARDLIISKEVSKMKKSIYGVNEVRRLPGSARGNRSDLRSRPNGSSQRRKRSEVAKELSQEHDIELRE